MSKPPARVAAAPRIATTTEALALADLRHDEWRVVGTKPRHTVGAEWSYIMSSKDQTELDRMARGVGAIMTTRLDPHEQVLLAKLSVPVKIGGKK